MRENSEKNEKRGQRERRVPTVSARLPDGALLEVLYRPEEERTLFALSREGEISEVEEVKLPDGRLLVPYSPRNNLITHKAILLPSEAAEYGSEAALRRRVRDFLHRYVALPEDFGEVAAHYVCLTWIHDSFPDLPYLRALGDYGSGKSRFLRTIGSISYRPIFASGASTVSPLFRILDSIGGTLVLDEGDFRFSDEKADIVKILNNGSSRGFPVLRSEATPTGEFNPKAFSVFGPKVIATRKHFDDQALESRCITVNMDTVELRPEIPHNLPPDFDREALALRNELLTFRLRSEPGSAADPESLRTLLPRTAQVFSALLSSVKEPEARERLLWFARAASTASSRLREDSIEADVVREARGLQGSFPGGIPVKEIARRLEAEEGAPLTPRAVGAILRRLGLLPRKRQGNYCLPAEEFPKLSRLASRYGKEVDIVDVVDEPGEALS